MAGDKFFRPAALDRLGATFFFGFAVLAIFGLLGVFTAAMVLLLRIIIQLNQMSVKLILEPPYSDLAVKFYGDTHTTSVRFDLPDF